MAKLRVQVGPVKPDWWCIKKKCDHYKINHQPWFRFDPSCRHPKTIEHEWCRDETGHPVNKMKMCPVFTREAHLERTTNYLGDNGYC